MKRRDAVLFLGSAGVGTVLPAAAEETARTSGLTEAHVEALLRELAGVEPLPGEAARIKEALLGRSAVPETDPRVQPALAFHPEVEP
jgi:hypothetical protein